MFTVTCNSSNNSYLLCTDSKKKKMEGRDEHIQALRRTIQNSTRYYCVTSSSKTECFDDTNVVKKVTCYQTHYQLVINW